MGALVGLGVGVGLMLVWSAFALPRSRRTEPAGRGRIRELLALNAGLPGMCTIHANSAREALVKMCTLPLLAGENISARFVVPTVASSVDLVVHLGIDAHGTRRVNEIVGVPGRVENDIIETEPLFERRGGDLRRTGGMPPHIERYERIGIDVHRLLAEEC